MIKQYKVSELMLDENNPRFESPVSSQRDAINSVLSFAPSKLVRLAKDIVQRKNSLNPTELMVVVVEDGRTIVVEGNRRVAALKLLRKPDLAEATPQRKQFEKAAANGKGPSKVDCFLASSREAARHWIELRHTGQNDGVGVVGWESWQINNFRRKPGSQPDRADRFCAALEAQYEDQEELKSNIASVRRDRITTLGRLVSDPEVRRAFGFDLSSTGVEFHFDPAELLAGFAKLFNDLNSDLSVSEIKNKSQREAYANSARQLLPAPEKRLPRPVAPGEISANSQLNGVSKNGASSGIVNNGPTSNGRGGASKTKGRRRSRSEEKYIFQNLSLKNVTLRTSKTLKEAQTIHIDHAPSVAAVMTRVVVELVVTEAGEKLGFARENAPLKKKIGAALRKLDPKIQKPNERDKKLEPAWLRSQDETANLVQSMHTFMHNISSNAMPSEVRTLSDTFRELIIRLDDEMGNVSP